MENLKEKIDKLGIFKYKKIHPNNIKKKWPHLYNEILGKTKFLDKDVSFRQRLFHVENILYYKPKCPLCGNYVSFNNSLKKYYTFCSIICRNKSPKIRKRQQITWKNKPEEEKQNIQKKIEDTFYNNYGAKNVFSKESSLREKINEYIKEKYNVNNIFQLEEIKLKSKKTNLKKYGVEYNLQRKEIKDIQKINKRRSTYKKLLDHSNKINMIPMISENNFIENSIFHVSCYNNHNFYFNHFSNFFNWIDCPSCSFKTSSKAEREIQNFIKKLNIDIKCNDRKTIINNETGKYLELDIYIPCINKAIEYNGKYWHSFQYKKKLDKIKIKECKRQKIKLMIINEEDWLKNKNLVLEKIIEFIREG